MTAETRQKLIISVDDFGIRNTVPVVLKLAQAGKIDRVAVLVNYIRSKEEAEALKATGVKIDLHLEAIQLIKSGDKMKESALWRGANFFIRYLLGRVTRECIEREWVSQIERFRELFGRYPDGLNSHEHVHYFPHFFSVFVDLGNRYRVSFLRLPQKGILCDRLSLVSKVLAFLWKRDMRRHKPILITSSDFLTSYDWLKNFSEFVEMLPEGQTEVVFHPEREEEYAALMTIRNV